MGKKITQKNLIHFSTDCVFSGNKEIIMIMILLMQMIFMERLKADGEVNNEIT